MPPPRARQPLDRIRAHAARDVPWTASRSPALVQALEHRVVLGGRGWCAPASLERAGCRLRHPRATRTDLRARGDDRAHVRLGDAREARGARGGTRPSGEAVPEPGVEAPCLSTIDSAFESRTFGGSGAARATRARRGRDRDRGRDREPEARPTRDRRARQASRPSSPPPPPPGRASEEWDGRARAGGSRALVAFGSERALPPRVITSPGARSRRSMSPRLARLGARLARLASAPSRRARSPPPPSAVGFARSATTRPRRRARPRTPRCPRARRGPPPSSSTRPRARSSEPHRRRDAPRRRATRARPPPRRPRRELSARRQRGARFVRASTTSRSTTRPSSRGRPPERACRARARGRRVRGHAVGTPRGGSPGRDEPCASPRGEGRTARRTSTTTERRVPATREQIVDSVSTARAM